MSFGAVLNRVTDPCIYDDPGTFAKSFGIEESETAVEHRRKIARWTLGTLHASIICGR